MKIFRVKKILLGTILAIALSFIAIAGAKVHASSPQEITLTAEVSDVIAGQANPEFTVMFKIENNSGKIGGAEFVITPLDENILIGTTAQNYVKGDTWSDVNAGANIFGEKNIHILGSDDSGITKSSFLHGGYKFVYQGTPTGPIEFNVAYEAVCDEIGEENITVKFNNQTLTGDYSQANLTVTPREVDATNTLSGFTLSVNGTQVFSGTDDNQTIAEPIAYVDKANVKLSATRAGAESKIKITEGSKTIVAEQKSDVKDIPLGDLEEGEHTLTITVTSEAGVAKTYTLKFTVAAALATPITKPSASGTTTSGYSGSPMDFTPNGMADLVSSGKVKLYSVSESGVETEVGIDAFKPTNAGSYKIIARPNDGYVWEGDTTDAVYDFFVSKAVLSAIPAEPGKAPTFTSESYKGSLDGIVEYKYYSDAACTQEISKSELTPGTKYYAKPVLKDGAENNFEFDKGNVTQGYIESGFEYEVPKAPNDSDSNPIGGLQLWVWIIIGAVVLLLILLLIILLVVGRKKKNKAEKYTVQDVSPVAAPTAQQALVQSVQPQVESVTEKTEKLEERMHEMERDAQEREITRYKEEIERAEKKADDIKKEQTTLLSQQPVQSDIDVKIEKLGAEIRLRDEELKKQMQLQLETQREAEYKREKERLSERVDDAEKEVADLKEKLKTAEVSQELKALHFAPASLHSKNSGTEDSEVDAETYSILRAYEERLRSMEREMQERKMETMVREENERVKREMEDAARMRRHEEEMQRLRDLQQQEQLRRREMQQPFYGQYVQQAPQQSTMNYQMRQQELELQRLKLLEEQLKQKELENRLLNEQLRQQYAGYPVYGYAPYPPYGENMQQPFVDPNKTKNN